MLCIKFRFDVRLLFFKKLWPAFQPSKALVGRNGKADVFCRRRKTVFDLMYDYFRMQCGNITQEALASKINRSREFLAKIEKGTEHPSVATLVDIADALCISIDDLLIDSLHYSVSTSNTELHRLLLDCNETEQEIIIRTARELKATLVSLGI